jgi:hypothetical protein
MEFLECEKLDCCGDLDVSYSYFVGSYEGTFCLVFSFGGSCSPEGSDVDCIRQSNQRTRCALLRMMLTVGGVSEVIVEKPESKFDVPPTDNEKEVYATFLSTRIGTNAEQGEFEHDWYFNSTRVLIHRLLRTPETRSRRRVVVQPHSSFF